MYVAAISRLVCLVSISRRRVMDLFVLSQIDHRTYVLYKISPHMLKKVYRMFKVKVADDLALYVRLLRCTIF